MAVGAERRAAEQALGDLVPDGTRDELGFGAIRFAMMIASSRAHRAGDRPRATFGWSAKLPRGAAPPRLAERRAAAPASTPSQGVLALCSADEKVS